MELEYVQPRDLRNRWYRFTRDTGGEALDLPPLLEGPCKHSPVRGTDLQAPGGSVTAEAGRRNGSRQAAEHRDQRTVGDVPEARIHPIEANILLGTRVRLSILEPRGGWLYVASRSDPTEIDRRGAVVYTMEWLSLAATNKGGTDD
jgi:hypothetical protein